MVGPTPPLVGSPPVTHLGSNPAEKPSHVLPVEIQIRAPRDETAKCVGLLQPPRRTGPAVPPRTTLPIYPTTIPARACGTPATFYSYTSVTPPEHPAIRSFFQSVLLILQRDNAKRAEKYHLELTQKRNGI
ncbi:hypothetical protein TcasGA2_TC010792 [Tribolium castaneum]|uniref:Uncharacterized protein n=1 Tax=Tribolium castaneum TaxID=7070 RepID=D6W7M2_TRICA|nr:hypothetical protein TcasGA2_TC010792 [Tribolium castaneum]